MRPASKREGIFRRRHVETHRTDRIGWLRAAVLGANDGIVSTASLILGVAAAESSRGTILVAGVAGLVAGAMSMAAGEYVSVSSQADTEGADLQKEREELATGSEHEHAELAAIYAARGLDPALAKEVARQLMVKDALGAHARDELGISEILSARPIQAALASGATFSVGAALPILVVVFVPISVLVWTVSASSLFFSRTSRVALGQNRRRLDVERRSTSDFLGGARNGSHRGRRCPFWSQGLRPLKDPIALFKTWLQEAVDSGMKEPTAMTVATVDLGGAPDARMLLLKGCDERGFVFYTNLESPKAQALWKDSRVALCFFWAALEKQARIRGVAALVSDEEADAYFATRPRLSQISAWASKQSQAMDGFFELEAAIAKVALRFGAGTIPRPSFWSGFRVVPERIEFWHGKPFRRHHRILYVRAADGWQTQFLYP